jgi:exopolysaccharide biosynthesis protein
MLESALSVPKVYWLLDEDVIAPEPDRSCYSYYTNAADMGGFLEAAQGILDGQQTLFHTGITLQPGTTATCYLDETLMAITWKEVVEGSAATITEIKLRHPSQFRRYLTEDTYGSRVMKHTTAMGSYVNAVVACAGDFHYNRPMGLVVYDGTVWREEDALVDTCHINGDGDLLFTYAGKFANKQEAQDYVDQQGIRFSISFGPVLVDQGKAVEGLASYLIGQVNDRYSRAMLCQMGPLHYVVVTINMEGNFRKVMNIHQLQALAVRWGAVNAYTLDGGQTGTISMDGKLYNRPDWGEQKYISDIFYFATAVPDGS